MIRCLLLMGFLYLINGWHQAVANDLASVEIKIMLQQCDDSPLIPLSKVSLSVQTDLNDKSEGFLCETRVNDNGIARCFVAQNCRPTQLKLYYNIALERKKHFNVSPNKIELIVEQCKIVKPPLIHKAIYRHSHCTNFDNYVKSFSSISIPQAKLTSIDNKADISALTEMLQDSSINVEKSTKDALNLAQVYKDTANLFPKGSKQYSSFKEKEIYYRGNATLAVNVTLEQWLQSNAHQKDPFAFKLVKSASLSDFYNNMNFLRANKSDITQAILQQEDTAKQLKALQQFDRLLATTELDFNAITTIKSMTKDH